MSKLKSNVVFISAPLLLLNLTFAYYMQKLAMFSFDMNTMNEYPVNYETSGTAVPLKNKVKIVPKLPDVQGKIFAKEKLETLQWETQFKIAVDTSSLAPIGDEYWDDLFAIWYLVSKPKLADRKTKDPFGYK